MAIGVQMIIIIYNHLSGFYPLDNVTHFFIRLVRGVTLSMIAGILITFPDIILINFLNHKFQWKKRVFARLIIQLAITVIIAFIVSVLVTLFANWISPYTEDLYTVLLYNALIYAVVNILVTTILEGWLFFMESDKAKMKAETLERELSQIRFEVLKSQINPHFMFNSLNVLSGLIEKDVAKAQLFIDEFSHIYRYVLETIEKPVVSLEEELGFVRSYIFLQQIRYGGSLTLSVNLPSNMLKMLLPPLSLQTILENAIKHNIVNQLQPLQIDISNEDRWLLIRNNMQPKISSGRNTGLGQKNLVKRYTMIGEDKPIFTVETNHYLVKLPLINNENNESIDH